MLMEPCRQASAHNKGTSKDGKACKQRNQCVHVLHCKVRDLILFVVIVCVGESE